MNRRSLPLPLRVRKIPFRVFPSLGAMQDSWPAAIRPQCGLLAAIGIADIDRNTRRYTGRNCSGAGARRLWTSVTMNTSDSRS